MDRAGGVLVGDLGAYRRTEQNDRNWFERDVVDPIFGEEVPEPPLPRDPPGIPVQDPSSGSRGPARDRDRPPGLGDRGRPAGGGVWRRPAVGHLRRRHRLGDAARVDASTGRLRGLRYSGAERVPAELVDPEGGVTRVEVENGWSGG